MKKCIKCGIEKGFEFFTKRKSAKDGYRGECRECLSTYHKNWSDDNRERVRYGARTKALEYRYGMTHEDVQALKVQQGNKCLICSTDISKSFHVDHNHETGEVRGLLCGPCNRGIGYLKDNPQFILNAYQYLIEKGHYGQEAA